jgi:hypothetical protein
MATESVNAGIPWLHDLVIDGIRFDDPERIATAAQNVNLPLTHGVKAIGKLLASAACNKDDPPGPELLNDLGFLLEMMGEMIATFGTMESNASFQAFNPAGEWVRNMPAASQTEN